LFAIRGDKPDVYDPDAVRAALEAMQIDVRDQNTLRKLEHPIKLDMLTDWCQRWTTEPSHILVFCFSNQDVISAHSHLKHKFLATCIHGRMHPKERLQVLEPFVHPPLTPRILIASDVLARGLDLNITHIIQMDMAKDPKMYLHRLGRTARMGRSGKCVSLVGLNDTRLAKALDTPENMEFLFRRKQRLSENLKSAG